jgi:Icc-related predicted phosphoesterase
MSDLHLEFSAAEYPEISQEADVIILAGDTAVTPRDLQFYVGTIRMETAAPIIVVLGNHEYYGHQLVSVPLDYIVALSKIDDVYMVERGAAHIGNVRFFGATLWSFIPDGLAVKIAKDIEDYHSIYNEDPEFEKHPSCVTPTQTVQKWRDSVKFLDDALGRKFDGLSVIVTHYAPSINSVVSEYVGDPVGCAFYSDLDYLIEKHQPRLWVHGHMHQMRAYRIGDTQVLCNPRGYPFEALNTGFINNFIYEI